MSKFDIILKISFQGSCKGNSLLTELISNQKNKKIVFFVSFNLTSTKVRIFQNQVSLSFQRIVLNVQIPCRYLVLKLDKFEVFLKMSLMALNLVKAIY